MTTTLAKQLRTKYANLRKEGIKNISFTVREYSGSDLDCKVANMLRDLLHFMDDNHEIETSVEEHIRYALIDFEREKAALEKEEKNNY